jgi:uncharacterized protein
VALIDLLSDHAFLVLGVMLAGIVAGFAGGMFGIGGGIITVPVLYAVFQSLGVGEEASLKTAIGTSLSVIVVTSIRSLMTHHRAGHVDGEMLRAWAPWIALGAAAGGILARWAPVELLTIIFAGGAIYIGYRRIFPKNRTTADVNLMHKRLKIPLGAGTGLFSSLMGLGGGAVGVMVMTLAGRPMHQAIATSAGFGIAVAVPGVIGFMISGWGAPGLPPASFGFVNAAAFAAMAAMAAITAPMGARLAHRLHGALLSKMFGLYVFVAAAGLVWDVFHP